MQTLGRRAIPILVGAVALLSSTMLWRPATVAAGSTGGLTQVREVNAYPTFIGALFTAYPSNACGGSTYKVAGENPSPIERARLAMLMTAVVSGKQVWVASEGCEGPLELVVFVGLYQ